MTQVLSLHVLTDLFKGNRHTTRYDLGIKKNESVAAGRMCTEAYTGAQGGTPSSKPNLAYLMYVLSNEYEKSIPHQQQIRPKLHPKSDDNFLFREISGLPPPPPPP